MHHLVTTSLESTWYNKNKINSNILFLTSACKLYSRKHIWLSLKNLTLPYHWKEREKVRIDHIYLNDLYERVLVDLAIYINESIKIKEDKEYWRIILGPWLILYISIIFDRWEQLRIAYRTFNQFSTSIISNIEEKIDVAKSYEEFTKLMQTDLWNHLIYSRIIKFNYSDSTFVTNQLIEIETPFGDCNKRKKKKKRIGFFNIIERIFHFFGSKNHIFIYDSYFSQISLIKLNLNLFQFPYSYREVFKLKQNFEKDIEARCMLKPNRFLSDFESFLYTYILRDIPKVYLEGGRSAQTYVKNINENPKVIVTANSHWSNDIFKWWMAEKKKTGTKIISIACRDHEAPDGDVVRIWLNDRVVVDAILLDVDFKEVFLDLNEGINKIEIEALNQGESGPNTAQFTIYDEKKGMITTNKWNLTTGVKAKLIILKTDGELQKQ